MSQYRKYYFYFNGNAYSITVDPGVSYVAKIVDDIDEKDRAEIQFEAKKAFEVLGMYGSRSLESNYPLIVVFEGQGQ